MILAAIATLVLNAPPVAALPSAWEHWSASRTVAVTPTAGARLVRFALPVSVYDQAQPTLDDLRIITQTGAEVPYTIDVPQPEPPEVWTDLGVFDTGFVPGKYSQAVADLGSSGAPHNVLKVDVTAADGDFFHWASVDASDDNHLWRVVRERAPIFRFSQDGIEGRQDVSFPETRSRFLRIRVLDGSQRFEISGISVANTVETHVERWTLPTPVTLNPQSPAQKSWWDADTHIKYAPVSAVVFSASQPAFHRLVTVSSSADGSAWEEEAQVYIYRENGASQLLVEVPSGQARLWRITIFNRDDTPVEGLRVQLLTTPKYIVFRQMPDQRYLLVYGNTRAQAPEYDFATLTTPAQRAGAALVAAGPESHNSAYLNPEPPPPWSERHAWVLWAALIAAVVIIGALSIRMMR